MIAQCPHCACDFVVGVERYDVVSSVEYASKVSSSNPNLTNMVVTYKTEEGLTVREYVCFEHKGFPRQQAEKWWQRHSLLKDVPPTTAEAMNRLQFLAQISVIGLKKKEKYWNVVEVRNEHGRILTEPKNES